MAARSPVITLGVTWVWTAETLQSSSKLRRKFDTSVTFHRILGNNKYIKNNKKKKRMVTFWCLPSGVADPITDTFKLTKLIIKIINAFYH